MSRAKDAIKDAFWSLLNEKPYSSITVKDFVKADQELSILRAEGERRRSVDIAADDIEGQLVAQIRRRRVAPKALQIVEFPGLIVEDVDHHRREIQQHPGGSFGAMPGGERLVPLGAGGGG